MNQDMSMQRLQDLFTFPFKDPKWVQKLLIAAALALAGLILFMTVIFWIVPFAFLYGYFAALIREVVIEQGEPSLPEWDNWGDLFIDGLKLTFVGLIYVLPVLLLFLTGYGLMFAIPIFSEIIGTGNQTIAEVILPLATTSGFMVTFGLAMLLSMVVGAIMPVVTAHVVVEDDILSAFRIPEWWAIYRANLGGFLLSFLLIFGLSMLASFAVSLLYYTIILCCLVPLLMAALSGYLIVVSGAIFGEAYRVGLAKLKGAEEQEPEEDAATTDEAPEEQAS